MSEPGVAAKAKDGIKSAGKYFAIFLLIAFLAMNAFVAYEESGKNFSNIKWTKIIYPTYIENIINDIGNSVSQGTQTEQKTEPSPEQKTDLPQNPTPQINDSVKTKENNSTIIPTEESTGFSFAKPLGMSWWIWVIIIFIIATVIFLLKYLKKYKQKQEEKQPNLQAKSYAEQIVEDYNKGNEKEFIEKYKVKIDYLKYEKEDVYWWSSDVPDSENQTKVVLPPIRTTLESIERFIELSKNYNVYIYENGEDTKETKGKLLTISKGFITEKDNKNNDVNFEIYTKLIAKLLTQFKFSICYLNPAAFHENISNVGYGDLHFFASEKDLKLFKENKIVEYVPTDEEIKNANEHFESLKSKEAPKEPSSESEINSNIEEAKIIDLKEVGKEINKTEQDIQETEKDVNKVISEVKIEEKTVEEIYKDELKNIELVKQAIAFERIYEEAIKEAHLKFDKIIDNILISIEKTYGLRDRNECVIRLYKELKSLETKDKPLVVLKVNFAMILKELPNKDKKEIIDLLEWIYKIGLVKKDYPIFRTQFRDYGVAYELSKHDIFKHEFKTFSELLDISNEILIKIKTLEKEFVNLKQPLEKLLLDDKKEYANFEQLIEKILEYLSEHSTKETRNDLNETFIDVLQEKYKNNHELINKLTTALFDNNLPLSILTETQVRLEKALFNIIKIVDVLKKGEIYVTVKSIDENNNPTIEKRITCFECLEHELKTLVSLFLNGETDFENSNYKQFLPMIHREYNTLIESLRGLKQLMEDLRKDEKDISKLEEVIEKIEEETIESKQTELTLKNREIKNVQSQESKQDIKEEAIKTCSLIIESLEKIEKIEELPEKIAEHVKKSKKKIKENKEKLEKVHSNNKEKVEELILDNTIDTLKVLHETTNETLVGMDNKEIDELTTELSKIGKTVSMEIICPKSGEEFEEGKIQAINTPEPIGLKVARTEQIGLSKIEGENLVVDVKAKVEVEVPIEQIEDKLSENEGNLIDIANQWWNKNKEKINEIMDKIPPGIVSKKPEYICKKIQNLKIAKEVLYIEDKEKKSCSFRIIVEINNSEVRFVFPMLGRAVIPDDFERFNIQADLKDGKSPILWLKVLWIGTPAIEQVIERSVDENKEIVYQELQKGMVVWETKAKKEFKEKTTSEILLPNNILNKIEELNKEYNEGLFYKNYYKVIKKLNLPRSKSYVSMQYWILEINKNYSSICPAYGMPINAISFDDSQMSAFYNVEFENKKKVTKGVYLANKNHYYFIIDQMATMYNDGKTPKVAKGKITLLKGIKPKEQQKTGYNLLFNLEVMLNIYNSDTSSEKNYLVFLNNYGRYVKEASGLLIGKNLRYWIIRTNDKTEQINKITERIEEIGEIYGLLLPIGTTITGELPYIQTLQQYFEIYLDGKLLKNQFWEKSKKSTEKIIANMPTKQENKIKKIIDSIFGAMTFDIFNKKKSFKNTTQNETTITNEEGIEINEAFSSKVYKQFKIVKMPFVRHRGKMPTLQEEHELWEIVSVGKIELGEPTATNTEQNTNTDEDIMEGRSGVSDDTSWNLFNGTSFKRILLKNINKYDLILTICDIKNKIYVDRFGYVLDFETTLDAQKQIKYLLDNKNLKYRMVILSKNKEVKNKDFTPISKIWKITEKDLICMNGTFRKRMKGYFVELVEKSDVKNFESKKY